MTLPETLRWGLYYIEEISAPEGYLIQTESLPVMIGHDGDEPGQTYELNIEMQDEPVKGQILVKRPAICSSALKPWTHTAMRCRSRSMNSGIWRARSLNCVPAGGDRRQGRNGVVRRG